MPGDKNFPLKQGDLDFACGIYAVINAMAYRGEITELDQAALQFRLAYSYMQSEGWNMAKTMCFGIDPEDFEDLLEVMEWHEIKYEEGEESLLPYFEDDASGKMTAIVAIHTEQSLEDVYHYTVVVGGTPDRLEIRDSQGIEELVKDGEDWLYGEKRVDIGSVYVILPSAKQRGA